MKVLFDTCFISELNKPRPNIGVRDFLDRSSAAKSFLSVVTIGEIVKGIERLSHGRKKIAYRQWLEEQKETYAERVLDVNIEIAQIWGELTALAQSKGRVVAASDGLIAATALHHGLHIVTRNVADFEPTGAMLINPWDA